MLSATLVREMTVCVMFGAPRAGFARASCRRQFIGHLSDGARGNGFWANVIITWLFLRWLRRVCPMRAATRADKQLWFALIAIRCLLAMHL